MPQRYKPIEIRPRNGGRLVVRQEEDPAGEVIYVQKKNWRRYRGKELRVEGREKFNPDATVAIGDQPLNAEDPVTLLFQFRRPNGERALIGAAGDKLYRFFNNTAYSYVEAGYVSTTYHEFGGFTGAMSAFKYEFGGWFFQFEFVSSDDLTLLPASGVDVVIGGFGGGDTDYNGTFPVVTAVRTGPGSWTYTLTCTVDEAVWTTAPTTATAGSPEVELTADYVDDLSNIFGWLPIAAGLSTDANRWEAVSLNGYGILNNGVDLPLSYRVEDLTATPIYELREQGIAQVGHIQEFGAYLLCMDLKEIAAEDFEDWMNDAPDPYGIVDEGTYGTLRTHYAVAWSHTAEPRRWGVTAPGSIPGSGNVFTADYPLRSFSVNQGVTLDNAGPSGGALTTTISSISVDMTEFTLVASADAGVPATSTMIATDMLGTAAGRSDLQDDATRILTSRKIQNRLAIYRESGVVVCSFTGDVDVPFTFERFYSGRDVPDFRHTVVDDEGGHLYMSFSGFFRFDLVTRRPREMELFQWGTDLTDRLDADDVEDVFAVDNRLTREVFFCTPIETLRYHYDRGQESLGVCDDLFSAAAMIQKPRFPVDLPSEEWFILGQSNGIVYRYGLGPGYAIYNRDGEEYDSVLESGLMGFGDTFNEKDLRSYELQVTGSSSATAIFIEILRAMSVHATPEVVATATFTPGLKNAEPLFFRGTLFRDRITVSGKDNPVEIAVRTFEVSAVHSRGATQMGLSPEPGVGDAPAANPPVDPPPV